MEALADYSREPRMADWQLESDNALTQTFNRDKLEFKSHPSDGKIAKPEYLKA